MKIYLLGICLLSFSATLFSQQTIAPVTEVLQTDYIKKYKIQKTIAWVLLGSGIGIAVIDISRKRPKPVYAPNGSWFYIPPINSSRLDSFDDSQRFLLYVAGITSLASIPFYISAHKNKKRAKATVTFKNQRLFTTVKNNIVNLTQPSIVFKIGI